MSRIRPRASRITCPVRVHVCVPHEQATVPRFSNISPELLHLTPGLPLRRPRRESDSGDDLALLLPDKKPDSQYKSNPLPPVPGFSRMLQTASLNTSVRGVRREFNWAQLSNTRKRATLISSSRSFALSALLKRRRMGSLSGPNVFMCRLLVSDCVRAPCPAGEVRYFWIDGVSSSFP